MKIAYRGTNFHGWQKQPNGVTVQSTIEECFFRLMGQKEHGIVGCGRTDAGVHASEYYFHTDLDTKMTLKDLKYKLNHVLPSDITVINIMATKEQNAHARYDAYSRSYIYHLHLNKNPFKEV